MARRLRKKSAGELTRGFVQQSALSRIVTLPDLGCSVLALAGPRAAWILQAAGRQVRSVINKQFLEQCFPSPRLCYLGMGKAYHDSGVPVNTGREAYCMDKQLTRWSPLPNMLAEQSGCQ